MSTESQALDPYDIVLADLRAKREQIDKAIQAIEGIRAGAGISGGAVSPAVPSGPTAAPIAPGDFLGMTIVDAGKVLLAKLRRPLTNGQLATAFKEGGLHLTSADPSNTIGTVMTRRFKEVGDVVKIGPGIWGLKEWYPNRNFKKAEAKAVPADSDPLDIALDDQSPEDSGLG